MFLVAPENGAGITDTRESRANLFAKAGFDLENTSVHETQQGVLRVNMSRWSRGSFRCVIG
jgi:hypothetical protein